MSTVLWSLRDVHLNRSGKQSGLNSGACNSVRTQFNLEQAELGPVRPRANTVQSNKYIAHCFRTSVASIRNNDTGSSIPFVLLCFLLAALLVAGVTTASSAFLAQRDLQADCDGAALAAASAYQPSKHGGLAKRQALPLAQKMAQHAVDEYRADRYPGDEIARMSAHVDQEIVTVTCERQVAVPFARVFLGAEKLPRTAASSARSPLRN